MFSSPYPGIQLIFLFIYIIPVQVSLSCSFAGAGSQIHTKDLEKMGKVERSVKMLGINESLNGVVFSWRNSHLKGHAPLFQVNPLWNPFSTPGSSLSLQQFGIHEFHTIQEYLEEILKAAVFQPHFHGLFPNSPPPPHHSQPRSFPIFLSETRNVEICCPLLGAAKSWDLACLEMFDPFALEFF